MRWDAVHESRAARWGRRAITIPLYVAVGAVLVGGLPLWLGLAVVADLIRRVPWVATRCVLFFVLYVACEVAGIVASLLLWRPLPLDELARDRHYRLQVWWARTLFAGAQHLFGFEVAVEGDDDVGCGPLLVLMCHVSVADTPLPVVLLNGRHRLRMRYVLKRELLWDPCLDLVGQRLPNVFVRRGSGQPAREAALVASLAEGLGRRDGVLIYPEGTRFSPAKRERAFAVLAAQGDPARCARVATLRHVLPPRLAGVLALLDAAPEADVLIIAHIGFEAAASFAHLWRGGLVGQRMCVRLWRVPRRDIPRSAEARGTWLDGEWARIDAWIAAQRDGRSVLAA